MYTKRHLSKTLWIPCCGPWRNVEYVNIYIYIYIHIQTTKERYEYEKASVKMISGLFLYSMQGYRICQLYFVCQCIHIHTHTHTHAHTHTHKHAHACTYKRTHTHINTHIHTNARVCEETDSVRTHILQYSLTKSTITCLFSRSHLKQRACECATYKFSWQNPSIEVSLCRSHV